MSGTVRISQLSSVSGLSSSDVIVVNVDGNSDTRTISFSDFVASLAPVRSVNTVQPDSLGAITLVPSNIGAASQVDLDTLGQTVAANGTQLTINSGLISDNAVAIQANTTAILEHRALTGVDQLAPGDNIYTSLLATITAVSDLLGDTGPDSIETQLAAEKQARIDGDAVEVINRNNAITQAIADEVVRSDAAYAPASSATGNASDIATNASDIASNTAAITAAIVTASDDATTKANAAQAAATTAASADATTKANAAQAAATTAASADATTKADAAKADAAAAQTTANDIQTKLAGLSDIAGGGTQDELVVELNGLIAALKESI